MKILVTGASGFIGSHLVPRLSSRHEVHALVRRPAPNLERKNVTPIIMDLAEFFDSELLPARVDVVIHLAQANVPFPEKANELFAVNTVATQRLLDYSRRVGAARFVLASSGEVYGSKRMDPCKETDSVQPESFYALTKYISEQLALAYASYLQVNILRLFSPYGPGQTNRLIPKMIQRIREGQPIELHQDDHPCLTPTYIDDVLMIFEKLLETPYSGILNVGGEESVSLRELTEILGRALDASPRFNQSGREKGNLVADNSLAKKILGMEFKVGLTEGIARILKSQERQECPLPN